MDAAVPRRYYRRGQGGGKRAGNRGGELLAQSHHWRSIPSTKQAAHKDEHPAPGKNHSSDGIRLARPRPAAIGKIKPTPHTEGTAWHCCSRVFASSQSISRLPALNRNPP